jgi:hypothetical protein
VSQQRGNIIWNSTSGHTSKCPVLHAPIWSPQKPDWCQYEWRLQIKGVLMANQVSIPPNCMYACMSNTLILCSPQIETLNPKPIGTNHSLVCACPQWRHYNAEQQPRNLTVKNPMAPKSQPVSCVIQTRVFQNSPKWISYPKMDFWAWYITTFIKKTSDELEISITKSASICVKGGNNLFVSGVRF